jgi:hypothetical protein
MMTSLDSLFDESLVAAQQPQWPGGKDGAPVQGAVTRLKTLPPLVFAGECDDLKAKIADAAAGKAFWLQGEIAQRLLLLQLLIQFEIALRQFCRWQLFCSITPVCLL